MNAVGSGPVPTPETDSSPRFQVQRTTGATVDDYRSTRATVQYKVQGLAAVDPDRKNDVVVDQGKRDGGRTLSASPVLRCIGIGVTEAGDVDQLATAERDQHRRVQAQPGQSQGVSPAIYHGGGGPRRRRYPT